jgi:hypothetical protein
VKLLTGLDDRGSIPGRVTKFSPRYLVPTEPGAYPVPSVMGSGGGGFQSARLIIQLHLVSRLNISGALPPLNHTSSWCDA